MPLPVIEISQQLLQIGFFYPQIDGAGEISLELLRVSAEHHNGYSGAGLAKKMGGVRASESFHLVIEDYYIDIAVLDGAQSARDG